MRRRWRVDVYYSGFTAVEVMAGGEEEAIEKGREEAHERLAKATVLDEDGSLCHLIRSLEPTLGGKFQLILDTSGPEIRSGFLATPISYQA